MYYVREPCAAATARRNANTPPHQARSDAVVATIALSSALGSHNHSGARPCALAWARSILRRACARWVFDPQQSGAARGRHRAEYRGVRVRAGVFGLVFWSRERGSEGEMGRFSFKMQHSSIAHRAGALVESAGHSTCAGRGSSTSAQRGLDSGLRVVASS